MLRAASAFLHGRNAFYVALLLAPPLLWLGHGLPRLALRAARAELLRDRRVHRRGSCRSSRSRPTASSFAHPANVDIVLRTVRDGGRGHLACARHRLPGRELHGALRRPADEGVLLRRRDAADVDELPRQGLRLAADPRQGGHRRLGAHRARRTPAARRRARGAGRRRPVARLVLPRHVHRLRLHVAAVHDPAARRGARARAAVAAAGLRRPRRATGPDLPQRDPAARAARARRRLDLHVLAHARRLHHPERRRRARATSSA